MTGFDYGNPAVRNIAFTRLGDRVISTAFDTSAAQAPIATAPTAAPPVSTATVPQLAALAGEYELAPGRTLAITLENGRLLGQPPDGEKRSLTHVSGTMFSVADSPMTLKFTLGGDGRATAVVMRQNGRERTLPRVQ